MESFKSQSLIMGQRLRELRTARHLSFESLKKALMEKYNISISIDSLKNYEVSQSWHTKAAQKEGMSIKYLRCFADFYGVSADYLLGMDVPQTPDVTIRDMVEKTGLSEQATKYLIDTNTHNPDLMHVLNNVLEEQGFFELVDEIGRYLGASMATLIVNRIQDDCFSDLDKQINSVDAFDEAYKKYANQLDMIAKSNSYEGFIHLYLEKYAAEALVSEQQHIEPLLSELSDIGFTGLCEYRSTIALSHLLKCLRTKHLLKSETEI